MAACKVEASRLRPGFGFASAPARQRRRARVEEARERGLLGEVLEMVGAVRADVAHQRAVRLLARRECEEGADAAPRERDAALRLDEIIGMVRDRERRRRAGGIAREEERVERAEHEHVGVDEEDAHVLRETPRVQLVRRGDAAHERSDAVHDEGVALFSAHRVETGLECGAEGDVHPEQQHEVPPALLVHTQRAEKHADELQLVRVPVGIACEKCGRAGSVLGEERGIRSAAAPDSADRRHA